MMESEVLSSGEGSQQRPVKRRARMALSCQRYFLKNNSYTQCILT